MTKGWLHRCWAGQWLISQQPAVEAATLEQVCTSWRWLPWQGHAMSSFYSEGTTMAGHRWLFPLSLAFFQGCHLVLHRCWLHSAGRPATSFTLLSLRWLAPFPKRAAPHPVLARGREGGGTGAVSRSTDPGRPGAIILFGGHSMPSGTCCQGHAGRWARCGLCPD